MHLGELLEHLNYLQKELFSMLSLSVCPKSLLYVQTKSELNDTIRKIEISLQTPGNISA